MTTILAAEKTQKDPKRPVSNFNFFKMGSYSKSAPHSEVFTQERSRKWWLVVASIGKTKPAFKKKTNVDK